MKSSRALNGSKLLSWAALGAICLVAEPLTRAGGDPQDEPPGAPRGSEPVELHPRSSEKGRAAPIEAGDIYLLALLQSLADTSGTSVVCQAGRAASGEKLKLARAIPRPDRDSISQALSAAGWLVSEETYRGKKVLWITRQLAPSGRRGALKRVEEGAEEKGEEDDGTGTGNGRGIRMFQSGSGRGATYLVLFETGVRADAEEAYQILQTLSENQRSKRER